MIKPLLDWLDHRAGVRKLVAVMLLEGVPGGAKWRYVWGSALAFVFSIQLVTGILLMTAYSPSSSQAWSSVHFIQYKMDFGWLIRGLHHFGSQTMVVLLALHMLQVVIAGAQLPPREVNWWLGIGLLSVTLGLSLTGYLLPWDQKGYWATRVATNIASNIPILGDDIKQLAVGGPDYGNHTLTRFYALHVSILPLSLIVLLVAHIAIFRRHGVTSKANIEGLVTRPENEHGAEPFWPRQAFYDLLACLFLFSIMLGLLFLPRKVDDEWTFGHAHPVTVTPKDGDAEADVYDYLARAGTRGIGAELDAPADRDTANYPARPEWYFLFLFQLLKYFKGDQILVGTVFIPNGVMLLLVLLPFFGFGPMRKIGQFFGMLVMMTILILVGVLTLFALRDDNPDGILFGLLKNTDAKSIKNAEHHQESVHKAEALAKRACQLAMEGSPVEGGHMLMRHDPLTAGQKLFQQKCGVCHSFTHQGCDKIKDSDDYLFESWTPKDKAGKSTASASDLGDFGSEEWVKSLLKDPMDPKHFGLMKAKDDKGNVLNEPAFTTMKTDWRGEIDEARKGWKQEQKDKQDAQLAAIAKWLADQAKERDQRDDKLALAGQAAFFDKANLCSHCHKIETREKGQDGKWIFATKGANSAPDLTDYGSAQWIRAMIMRPGHKSRYGASNLMPSFRNLDLNVPGSELSLQEFRETNKGVKDNMITNLPDVEREMIIRWIRRDYRPVFGGTVIAK